MTVEIHKRLFTVDEYHQMACAAVFSEDDRVELIDGEIIEMSPIGRRHAACVDRLTRLFVTCLGKSAIVRVQNPVALSQHSEPQPDVTLLRPRDDFYASAHPSPNDVLLIVEVGETSVEFDREVKVPRYAEAGIPEVWLVDLSHGTIDVHRVPSTRGYEQVQTASSGESLTPLSFPQLQLLAAELLS